jgi:hypothetical protein
MLQAIFLSLVSWRWTVRWHELEEERLEEEHQTAVWNTTEDEVLFFL